MKPVENTMRSPNGLLEGSCVVVRTVSSRISVVLSTSSVPEDTYNPTSGVL